MTQFKGFQFYLTKLSGILVSFKTISSFLEIVFYLERIFFFFGNSPLDWNPHKSSSVVSSLTFVLSLFAKSYYAILILRNPIVLYICIRFTKCLTHLKMLESRPEDALVKLVKTVEIVATVENVNSHQSTVISHKSSGIMNPTISLSIKEKLSLSIFIYIGKNTENLEKVALQIYNRPS